jgi:N-acetylglucosaminyl-diphospho-decaprenol L-rhamnosyltransferase
LSALASRAQKGAAPVTKPAVAVVVVSYNSASWLRRCVEPLVGAGALQVVVVDNASRDDSTSAVADLPVEVIALPENRGFASGCNIGFRSTQAPYVLFLNPDAQIDPEAIHRMVEVMERTGAGAVGPRIVDESGELEWSLRRFPTLRSIYGQALFAHRLFPNAGWVDELVRDPEAYEQEAPCDWASGACLLVRRDVLDRIDGFDEGFFLYREDVDLCRRITDLGRPIVFTPAATCTHAGGRSAPRWKLLKILASSRIRYARKHFRRVPASAYRFGVALGALTHVIAGRGLHRRAGHAVALLASIGLNFQIYPFG